MGLMELLVKFQQAFCLMTKLGKNVRRIEDKFAKGDTVWIILNSGNRKMS
jgi:hypothetical protein